MFSALSHARARRRALNARFDVARQMPALEETCIPSYVHANLAAAAIAWSRLFVAARVYKQHAPDGPVLDFGAGSGELAHVLPENIQYEFAEIDEAMARAIVTANPRAVRQTLDSLPRSHYAAILALDSLEHNDNVGELVDELLPALAPGGVLILSGPTENWFYRLGRRIAGFSGAYHKTNIFQIEQAVAKRATLVSRTSLPLPWLALFSVSCWKPRT